MDLALSDQIGVGVLVGSLAQIQQRLVKVMVYSGQDLCQAVVVLAIMLPWGDEASTRRMEAFAQLVITFNAEGLVMAERTFHLAARAGGTTMVLQQDSCN
jgi:hypothetical protein